MKLIPRVLNGVPQDQQAALNNGGRWHHIASEREIRRALTDVHAEVIEMPVMGLTFVVSLKHLTMLRATAFGGDTRNVEGGWVYPNSIALGLDKYEVVRVSDNTVSGRARGR